MQFIIVIILLCMVVLYYAHATDLIRRKGWGNYRIPLWFVFTPIAMPFFIVGLAAIILMCVFGSFAGHRRASTDK